MEMVFAGGVVSVFSVLLDVIFLLQQDDSEKIIERECIYV